ncbi:hypothetical protein E2C01_043266 [Portunus trituberculatus]|uniref:Uncharacterized protein n=1 Tax=Portunus trituberculatus TaxID=210409 RepID=A0A5B7FWU7_PORTR|nr:hypothetical protein [Portunus trituberculatus]
MRLSDIVWDARGIRVTCRTVSLGGVGTRAGSGGRWGGLHVTLSGRLHTPTSFPPPVWGIPGGKIEGSI